VVSSHHAGNFCVSFFFDTVKQDPIFRSFRFTSPPLLAFFLFSFPSVVFFFSFACRTRGALGLSFLCFVAFPRMSF